MHCVSRVAFAALSLLALAACGPSETQLAAQYEATRNDCLDKICYGDVAPRIDNTKDTILKLNGQWYAGPKEYFSSGKNGGGFYWPSRHPMFKGGNYPEGNQDHSDKAIEVFLERRQQSTDPKKFKLQEDRGWEMRFIELQKDGLLTIRKQVSPDLEIVSFNRLDGKAHDTTYYLATKQKSINSNAVPGISCLSATSTCTTSEFWQEDIYARLRFNVKHAQDWPSIQQEVIRILNLVKKVFP